MSGERCSELSRAAGEQLAGTATTTRSWLLVEVPGGWSRDVGSSDALGPEARAAVAAWLERTGGSRLLFVRRPGRSAGTSLAFVVSSEGEQPVRRIELGAADDLAALDLDTAGEESDAPLVLVCGHGSRDRCCALAGTAVFGALADAFDDEQVWLSSHQGGHRFAANVLVLPAGLHFGRVEPVGARRLVTAALAGTIDLERFRGLARYESAVQAADVAIRRAGGLTDVADLALVEADGERVRFVDRRGREWGVVVEEVEGPSLPPSCGAEPEPQVAYLARVL